MLPPLEGSGSLSVHEMAAMYVAARPRLSSRHQPCLGVSTLALLLSLSASLTAHSQSDDGPPVYRFGSGLVDDEGQTKGLVADALHEIEQSAGVTFEMVPLGRRRLEGAVRRGELDIISVSRGPERGEQFELSQPYSHEPLAIFWHVRAGEFDNLESLQGRSIGVPNYGRLQAAVASRVDAEITTYPSVTNGLMALEHGQIDAFICNQTRGANRVVQLGYDSLGMSAEGFMSDDLCFAASKGNVELIELLNQHLELLRQTGRLQELASRYPPGQLEGPSWMKRNQTLLMVMGIVGGLLLLSMVWNILLHRAKRRHRRAQAELRASEERLQLALSAFDGGIWDWNVKTGDVYLSPRWAAMLELEPDEIEGRIETWQDALHPEDRVKTYARLQAHFDGQTPTYESEHRMRTKSGDWIWVHDWGRVVERDADGKPMRMIGTDVNVTSRIEATSTIQRVQDRYRILYEQMPDVVTVIDPETGQFLEFNDLAARMLNYTRDEFARLTLADIEMKSLTEIREHVEKVQRHGTNDFETVLRTKQGQHRDVHVNVQAVHIDGQQVLHVIWRDITERKRAMKALQESETHQSLLLDSVPIALYSARIDGNYDAIYVGGQIEAITGFGADEFLKDDSFWASRLHPDDRDRVLEATRSLSEQETVEIEYRWQVADGTYRWFADHSVQVRDEHGKPSQGIGTWRDVTDRVLAHDRQQTLVNELDHRVKNMLATVQAISEQTLETAESPTRFVELFKGRLASLARVHEKLAERHWTGADLNDLVQQLVEPYGLGKTRVEVSGEEITLPVESVLPFSMAIHELVTNASKYGALSVPDGTIQIKWQCETADNDEVLVRWIERGGPNVSPPSHRGFGTRFIEEGIQYEIGGSVELRFLAAGVECDMRIPL